MLHLSGGPVRRLHSCSCLESFNFKFEWNHSWNDFNNRPLVNHPPSLCVVWDFISSRLKLESRICKRLKLESGFASVWNFKVYVQSRLIDVWNFKVYLQSLKVVWNLPVQMKALKLFETWKTIWNRWKARWNLEVDLRVGICLNFEVDLNS